jgi:hypothetical protein
VPRLLTDVDYWRDRAEEARTTADAFTSPEAKRVMPDIATGYEYLAECAERLLGATSPRLSSSHSPVTLMRQTRVNARVSVALLKERQ